METTTATLILGLPSGEHILCDVEERQGAYLCSNVLQIISERDDKNGVRMGLMPYMPYADPEGGLAVPTGMAIIAVPSVELKRHHENAFSKIVLPDSKIIL